MNQNIHESHKVNKEKCICNFLNYESIVNKNL